MHFETRAIHEGQEPDPATGALTTPIYQTSTYVQEAVGVHKGYDYARVANPDAHSASGVRRFARGRRPRACVLVRTRRRDDADASPLARRPRRRRERRIRRHLPHVHADLRAEGVPLHLPPAGGDLDRPRGAPGRAHEVRLARDTDEPGAEHRRHRRRVGGGPRRRRARRRRQHIRDAVPPAAARARRGHRAPFDDEVPRRALGRHRRLHRDERRRASPSGSPSCRSPWARCRGRSTRGSSCAA